MTAEPGALEADSGGTSRRSFLNTLLGVSGLAWAGTIAYPVIRYLRPPVEAGGANDVTLSDGDVTKVGDQGYTIVQLGQDRVIVLRDQRGKLHACQAKCTHEGCTVRYKRDEGLIWCACHNAKFTLDGAVISGPPPRPLPPYKVREATAGKSVKITVSRI